MAVKHERNFLIFISELVKERNLITFIELLLYTKLCAKYIIWII